MSKRQTKPNSTTRAKVKPTKAALVIKLLKRKTGASLKALMKATNWQSHSVRGFLSGTVKKRRGLNLTSLCGENGQRRYFVTDEAASILARTNSKLSSRQTPVTGGRS